MDLTSILVPAGIAAAVTLLVVLVAGWFALEQMRAMFHLGLTAGLDRTPVANLDDPAVPKLAGLTVIDSRCTGCAHFNLAAGQRVMRTQPAFATATTHLEPWQMARERPVIANPEYEELEGRFLKAQLAGDVALARDLHDQLLALDPGTVQEDTSDINQSMMELDWTRLGLCGHHRELRFATDTCEQWSTP